MSIIVNEDRTTEVRYYTRRVEFENAAPILLERNYSHGGKEFMPDDAHARWNHDEPIDSIRVSGFVMKKDRTTGNQRTDITYVTPSSRAWRGGWQPKAPDWLLEIFAIEAPTKEEDK